jgi:hypothetical protein
MHCFLAWRRVPHTARSQLLHLCRVQAVWGMKDAMMKRCQCVYKQVHPSSRPTLVSPICAGAIRRRSHERSRAYFAGLGSHLALYLRGPSPNCSLLDIE